MTFWMIEDNIPEIEFIKIEIHWTANVQIIISER